jgi:hypothetical protein
VRADAILLAGNIAAMVWIILVLFVALSTVLASAVCWAIFEWREALRLARRVAPFALSIGFLLAVSAALQVAALAIGRGHRGDLIAMTNWSTGMAHNGLAYYAAGGTGNYPAVLWLLWPLGYLDPAWQLLAIRGLSIPFDLATGWLIYRSVRAECGERAGLAGAAFWLLNPAVIIAGPLWGQVDAIGALPMLAAIVLAQRRPAVAGACAALAILVKPQFAIGALIVGLVVIRSPSRGIRTALAALGTAAAVLLPLGLTPPAYASLLTASADQYSLASSYAFNVWGAIFGFHTPDGGLAMIGAAAFVTAVALIIWTRRRRRDLAGLLATGVLIGLALYFIPTRVHERYLYGAVALLALLAGMERRLRWPFLTLSGLFAFSLLYSLEGTRFGVSLSALDIAAVSVAMMVTATWCAAVVSHAGDSLGRLGALGGSSPTAPARPEPSQAVGTLRA